ncbi:MAG TPA: protein kinase [Bryobacteraceae bacterium]|nr:protein kinase [Bryobacteraceae bacterium]
MATRKKIKERYETIDVLGKGGMGLVYKAYDTVVQREVAIKTLRDSPSKLALDLFRKECGVLASMSHPNIVEIFDIGEFTEDGATKPYFVMPLLPGVTLDALIKASSQRLTVERSVEIIVQTCRGLHAAHERGLVHRDLKPSNLFVMPDDTVKIIDFGVAHMADTTATMTVAGGTLPYMAPEQIEMKPASPLSDIFSLGVVFYETLTRRRPFDYPTEQETAQAILHNVPPAASELNPAVSQMVSRVIHKAMAKQPWNRFSTAKEFAETLLKAHRNEPIEIFDAARLQPRIQKATKAYEQGNYQFAGELLNELEAEGHVETGMTLLRRQLDQAVRQKNITQLLESARTCMQEEEYLLALQKIQEVLQLDPTNSAAVTLRATIETRRSEAKVEEWTKLARQHLENNAFSHARDALKSLLQLRPKDTTALQLMAEVDRREEQYVKARKEKEELYKQAMEAWQNGEMSSALTKLDRLVDLDRRVPDTSAPERGISYQNFYNQVRSEHDVLKSSYQEARKHLVDGNFAAALSVCQQYLNKYPSHALFQALKFDVEERQRQDFSSQVAAIDRAVEAEPDLERRVSILKGALEAHPGEPHFERALRLVRDKRDLVNSIVNKARSYEERGQFNEALGQWETLLTIHKQYPGLDFEIERVIKRREQQSRAEAKARWVEQIDRQIESGAFERALELLKNASAEYPDDEELASLGELARQNQARAAEAQQLFQQGQELSGQRQFPEAIEILRKAYSMDEGNQVVRTFLLETMLDQARAVIDTDWRAAEGLCQQALELDPSHALARGVRGMVLDHKREEEVGKIVAEARRMQAAGNVQGALEQIEQTLSTYPRDSRLVQLHATLSKALPDYQTRSQRSKAAAAAQQETVVIPPATAKQESAPAEAPAPETTTPEGWEAFEKRLRDQPPAPEPPPEIPTTFETQLPAATPASPPPLTPGAPPVEPSMGSGGDLGATVMFQAPTSDASLPVVTPPAPSTTKPLRVPPPAPPEPPKAAAPKPPLNRTLIAVAAAAVLLLVVAWFVARQFRPTAVVIRTHPDGATIRVDGEVRGTGEAHLKLRAGTYQLTAQKEGYQPATAPLVVTRGLPVEVNLTLQPPAPSIAAAPVAQVLRVTSDLQSGKVKFDGETPAELQDGQFGNDNLGLGKHSIEITSGSVKTNIAFEAAQGRMPVLTETPTAKEVKAVVFTSFQSQAHIQATYPAKVAVDNQEYGDAGGNGVDVSNLAPGNHEVRLTEGSAPPHILSLTNGNAPTIDVRLDSDRNVGSLLILATGADDVQVDIDGKPVKQRRKGRGGQIRISNLAVKQHTVRVYKEGYQDEAVQTADVKKGEEAKLEFHMRLKPTVAGLMVNGAAAGAQVKIDQKAAGNVQPDGSLTVSDIQPGNHVIEIAGYKPISRNFKAGETVPVTGQDLVAQITRVPVRIAVSPANATVNYKGPDGKTHEVRGPAVELDEGQYTFVATAPLHNPASAVVVVGPGKANVVNLNLPMANVIAKPSVVTMEQWASQYGWKLENGWYVHRGGNLVLYPVQPSNGTFVFSARRQGGVFAHRIEWVVGAADNASDYIRFGIDKKSFHRAAVVSGKKQKEDNIPLSTQAKDMEFTLRIEISPAGITTYKQDNGSWEKIDSYEASGLNPANGKFGFYLPGSDEVYISNFTFTAK